MQKIQDYALIGNTRSAALISKEGSIDWLCWPRFDSPSLFAALLDEEKGGRWKIAPTLPYTVERSYVEETNILKTLFSTETGKIELTDFMPVQSELERAKTLSPEEELIRLVECVEGFVDLEIEYDPRPNYGRQRHLRAELLTLHGFSPKLHLEVGESHTFSLTYHAEGPAITPSLNSGKKLEQSIAWWRNWASKVVYEGKWRKEVVRSALALKLLYFAPSGTFVAAPTTSLPERIGGDLNWDYRFSWLRDSSFVVEALCGLKMYEEVRTFINWLLYSTKLSLSNLTMFDIYGRYCGSEKTLKHFKGYNNSRPVRIGNAASKQFQLDVYGEVVEAVCLFIREVGEVNRSILHEVLKLGKFIAKKWKRPDNGIWESRGELHKHTYSLLMCWVAMNRILSASKIKLSVKLRDLFETTQKSIREVIENQSWNKELSSYIDILEKKRVGVSLLQLAIRGFEEAKSLRMKSTYAQIEKKLKGAPALYYRNEYAIERGEGAFLMCSFWNILYLTKGERREEAEEAFNQMLLYANDVGLFSEEIDPKTKEALGNFPQALSHAGLINAALTLGEK